jgi:hypothetical protein
MEMSRKKINLKPVGQMAGGIRIKDSFYSKEGIAKRRNLPLFFYGVLSGWKISEIKKYNSKICL